MSYYNKSLTDSWGTPHDLMKKYGWCDWFDPCPYPRAPFNGLEVDWLKYEKIFVNPPYSDKRSWSKKCYDTLQQAILENKPLQIDLLIPNNVGDTIYFHDYILNIADIEYIKGRLKFRDLTNVAKKARTAPFGSIICKYRHTPTVIEAENLNILKEVCT